MSTTHLPWVRRAMAKEGYLAHLFFVEREKGFVALATDRAQLRFITTQTPPRIPGGEAIFGIDRCNRRFTLAEYLVENCVDTPPTLTAVLDLCPSQHPLDMSLWWPAGEMDTREGQTEVAEHFETGTKLNASVYEDIVEGEPEKWKCWLCGDPDGAEGTPAHKIPIYFKHVDGRVAIVMPIDYRQ